MNSESIRLSPEWMQYGLDALRATLDRGDDDKRQMVEYLLACGAWDAATLSYPSALGRFNNCLNPGKPDFFKLMHVWALMRRFGRHDLFLAMADDLGYEVRLRATAERQQLLQARLVEALEENNRLTALLSHGLATIESPGFKLRVHPGLREGGAFSTGDEALLGDAATAASQGDLGGF